MGVSGALCHRLSPPSDGDEGVNALPGHFASQLLGQKAEPLADGAVGPEGLSTGIEVGIEPDQLLGHVMPRATPRRLICFAAREF